MMRTLANAISHLRMVIAQWFLWRPLIRKTRDPRAAQIAVLRSILRTNAGTVFGREHGFGTINSYDAYKAAVGVNDYEALRDYIEKQEAELKPYLYRDQPVMYAQTSGSSGKPKYIPILRRMLSQYRRSQRIVAYAIYRVVSGAYRGKLLAIVSPAVEGELGSGTPYGSMSGLIYKSMPRVMRTKYVVPPEIFEIEDHGQKYYQISKHALAESDITLIATANPSTLLKVKDIIRDRWSDLLSDIRATNAKRADALELLKGKKKQLIFADFWPGLKVVVTWKRGSCGVLAPSVKGQLGEGRHLVEMGYLASEFRGSITIDPLRDLEIPALHENFYEFVRKEDWGKVEPVFLLMDQLVEGEQYFVFVTTLGGLYRYNINDIIEVTGWYQNTPTIRFVQKGKGVVNLTGEKLYEAQILEAMIQSQSEADSQMPFFIMLGCAEKLNYTLFIERDTFDVERFEKHLGRLNIEFESKRKSERLKPTNIVFLKKGTGNLYERHCLQGGKREGQFKIAYLQTKQDCAFDFMSYERTSV